MPFFEHMGLRLHYVDAIPAEPVATRPTLLFIHGAGGSLILWSLQIKHFSQTHRVIALDLSGHGDSQATEEAPEIQKHYVRELTSLIQHLSLDNFVLIGHSMGGGIAMSYVLQNGVRMPRAMVLVSTSSDLDMRKRGPGVAKESIEINLFLLQGALKRIKSPEYELKQAGVKASLSHPWIMQKDLQACDHFDITDRVREITIPAFVIVGEHDDLIIPSVAKQLEESLPRADIAVIKGANHSPMIEQTEEFNRLLSKFLKWVESNP
ncbi:MAG: alpha/beta hydrolase [Candidatus Thorarchaeota archaeon]